MYITKKLKESLESNHPTKWVNKSNAIKKLQNLGKQGAHVVSDVKSKRGPENKDRKLT